MAACGRDAARPCRIEDSDEEGLEGGEAMTAYNVVRMRVKPGRENEFLEKNGNLDRQSMKGFRKVAIVKTGERSYCVIGEWDKFDDIVAARPAMIGLLDTFRDTLEDLGDGLGVTDPVSGEAVIEG
jgi:hypothetical protein